MQNKIKIILLFLFILITVIFLVFLFFKTNKPSEEKEIVSVVQEEKKEEIQKSKEEPEEENPIKTEYGSEKPKDFPIDIPVEEGAVISQSYDLNYVNQKQITIAFQSKKTNKQNYDLYLDFFEKNDWDIISKHESESILSLYGKKNQNEINVTISIDANTKKTQVSLTLLKK